MSIGSPKVDFRIPKDIYDTFKIWMANVGVEQMTVNACVRLVFYFGLRILQNWQFALVKDKLTELEQLNKVWMNPKGRPSKPFVLARYYNPLIFEDVKFD